MITKARISEFLTLARSCPVLDVRSPAEFAHAHIPGAHSLPLFTDEERKVVGTEYKQQSREQAIKTGLDYFGVKMRRMVEEAETIIDKHTYKNGEQKTVLVHCWRGGMRSAGVAWLLDLYGFKVATLVGGYKAFRNWTLKQFEKQYSFHILGGYTGSGKTELLQQLSAHNYAVVDLEGIANHKGSAFGGIGTPAQPSQEMFENILAWALDEADDTSPIWLEDESQRIGGVNIPNALWKTMRASPLYFLDIPFVERLSHIANTYGKCKKEDLVNAIIRIQKRLGNLNTKNAISHLLENNHKESFSILLTYYDKYYTRDLAERKIQEGIFTAISCDNTNPADNFKKLAHLIN